MNQQYLDWKWQNEKIKSLLLVNPWYTWRRPPRCKHCDLSWRPRPWLRPATSCTWAGSSQSCGCDPSGPSHTAHPHSRAAHPAGTQLPFQLFSIGAQQIYIPNFDFLSVLRSRSFLGSSGNPRSRSRLRPPDRIGLAPAPGKKNRRLRLHILNMLILCT